MTDQDNAAKVIRDLAREASVAQALPLGGYYVVAGEHGLTQIDLTGDEWMDTPRRKTGTVTVRDVASFAQYYAKHSDGGSEIFADLKRATITAVIDAHTARVGAATNDDGARWEGHRLILDLEKTDPWKAWVAASGRLVSQADFAEFLEAYAADVAPDGPISAADLLEVAQKFHAHTGVKFESGQRLASGETQFVYIESIEAKAGQRGELKIPSAFELAIVPYEDCARRRVTARFRYRLNSGGVQFGFILEDPERIARLAVEEIVAKAAEATGATIMLGEPGLIPGVPVTLGPRRCGACSAAVIQAFTGTHRPVLLDYPDPQGAVAARLDPETELWRARFLARTEPAGPDEVRFRQHSVTCHPTPPAPIVPEEVPDA